ncbi:MAG: hypothetical protein E6R03_04430 [Hyphomicrobiaceae bacterium]|nr:MAG: hypothetical protein E6R03_04430 [Hyphomicrobiaceae bacterium]
MTRTNLTQRNAFLAANPILSRCPDWDEDLVFFVVDLATEGLVLVLSDDIEHALRAAVVQWGRASCPTPALDEDGNPLTKEYPMLGGDSMQYLDATLVLEGDPWGPVMRGPDSAPALSMGAAMLSCASTRPVLRTPHGRMWESELDQRDEYLRRERLHIDGVTNAPSPHMVTTLIPKRKTYRDPEPMPCVESYKASQQPSESELRRGTVDAYDTQLGATVGPDQCEVIGEVEVCDFLD